MGMKEDLKELEDVLKETEAYPGPVLQLTDQTLLSKYYLTDQAVLALAKQTQNMSERDNDGNLCIPCYLATVVRTDHIEKAIERIAKIVNELAEKGYIFSTLTPISSIELAKMPKEHDASAVICFPLVPAHKMDEVKKIAGDLATVEGGLGAQTGSLEKELPEGQFYAEINLMANLTERGVEAEDLEKEIQQYLAILPKGTTVVSSRPCAIMTLAVPYEVIFYNPLMASFKEVKIHYRREAAAVNDRFETFNLITSVEYIRRGV